MSVTSRHRQFRHETEKVPMARATHRTELGGGHQLPIARRAINIESECREKTRRRASICRDPGCLAGIRRTVEPLNHLGETGN